MALNLNNPRPYELINLATNYHGDTLLSDMQAHLASDIANSGRTHSCPKCLTQGQYVRGLDNGDPTDITKVRCDVCDGWGYTTTALTGVFIRSFKLNR